MVLPEGETLNTLLAELERWSLILEAENIDWDSLEAQPPEPEGPSL